MRFAPVVSPKREEPPSQPVRMAQASSLPPLRSVVLTVATDGAVIVPFAPGSHVRVTFLRAGEHDE